MHNSTTISSQSLRFHEGEKMLADACMDYIEGKTTSSYAIFSKLSSLCNCDDWTKMIINLANFEFEFMHNDNF